MQSKLNVFNIQVLVSHISLSHRYCQSIKQNTHYKMYLFKGQKNCSQINQYQNRLISGKVFTGKILFNQLTFQFSIKSIKTDEQIIKQQYFDFNDSGQYSLRLFSVNKFTNNQQLEASYQLQIERYIRKFLQNNQSHFYEQGEMDKQIYITYQFFIQKTRSALRHLITQQKLKQKDKIKQKIIINLQNKNKFSKNLSKNDQQIQEQLRVLKHLSSDGKALSKNQKNTYQNNKIDLMQQFNKQSNKFTQNLLLNIADDDNIQFELKNSQIKIMQQLNSPIMVGTPFMFSKKGKKVKELMKFDESPFQINIKETQSQQISLKNDSNVITQKQNSQNKKDSLMGSQLSLNNQYRDYVLNFMSIDNKTQAYNQNQSGNTKKQKIGYQQNNLKSTRIPLKMDAQYKNTDNMIMSEISLKEQSIINQTRKTKFRIIIFLIIVVFLMISLTNDSFQQLFSQNYKKKSQKKIIKRNKNVSRKQK